ncbi:hypothetical protein OEZ85_005978 [Tetradesmus obliquus]|uniref:Uncharacterized protein n=1 Tax=Tetradesmus obliquus TaxID=3088 RepID=A0ABY8UF51_TETOB|nr:hypothetical protein OEZ85_005978 [Tetradesmus obliquus]
MAKTKVQWAATLFFAVATVAAFSYMVQTIDHDLVEYGRHSGRMLAAATLEQQLQEEAPRRRVNWGKPSNIAGIILSVLVSLTSSVDRECGAALYLVLFAVLLDMPIRNAMAMTAFTIACGSLAPAIAAMSEPHVTERGVLALVDYPGALILLPTMFWGLSLGVIVNMVFPSWLLALLWVAFMAVSNTELVWSLLRLRSIRKEVRQQAQQLLQLDAQAAAGGAAAAGSAGDAQSEQQQASQGELLRRLQRLRGEAEKLEAVALLYPAFHMPSTQQYMEQHKGLLQAPEHMMSSPSVTAVVDEERLLMGQLLEQTRSGSSRFTWRWKAWWGLQNHFEFALILKVVVLHLVTEAVRHKTTKPCSPRFWFMLCVMTGLVTAFLIFVARLLAHTAVSFFIGIFACALGLPAGPMMAWLLLHLGLKPHVVAGTSRFLVLCFCFGVFVAYIIAGNLHRQLAAAYGLLNLGLAPLGMLIFRKLNLRSHLLLTFSLIMGMLGMVSIVVWQLVPLLAHLAGKGHLLPSTMDQRSVVNSVVHHGNEFEIMRFCLGHT